MSFNLYVRHDTERQARQIGADARALPQVLRAFLTEQAIDVRTDVRKRMPNDIDRPTPFTLNALRWKGATRAQLVSEVYAQPIQAEYLYRLVEPGTRQPKARFVFVPAREQRSNAYGNMPKAKRRRVLGDPQLIVKQKGRARLAFIRRARQLEFIGAFLPSTQYSVKWWPFYRRAVAAYEQNAPRNFARAWARFTRSRRGR